MNEWFIIKDLQGFIDSSRVLVFLNFGKDSPAASVVSTNDLTKEELEELDSVLSYDESFIIAKNHMKKQKHKRSSENRYIISEDDYQLMISDLGSRMVSNLMVNLVKKGFVETAFDSDSNDFVFWVKENNEQNNKETP